MNVLIAQASRDFCDSSSLEPWGNERSGGRRSTPDAESGVAKTIDRNTSPTLSLDPQLVLYDVERVRASITEKEQVMTTCSFSKNKT